MQPKKLHIHRATNKNKITKLFSVVELPAKFTPVDLLRDWCACHARPRFLVFARPAVLPADRRVVWCLEFDGIELSLIKTTSRGIP